MILQKLQDRLQSENVKIVLIITVATAVDGDGLTSFSQKTVNTKSGGV